MLAVDEVHRTLLLKVHHVVDAELGEILVGDDRRNRVRERIADVVAKPEDELQRVALRVKRRVRRRKRPRDDGADHAKVGPDPYEPVALERLDGLERAAQDRHDLYRGQSALVADGGCERGHPKSLLRDVAADIRRSCRERTSVLVYHHFMPCHCI